MRKSIYRLFETNEQVYDEEGRLRQLKTLQITTAGINGSQINVSLNVGITHKY